MENVIHVWSCLVSQWKYMGVSKNRGTPKWMVYNTKPYWIGWFGGTTISGNIHMIYQVIQSVTQLDPLVGSEVTNDLFWDPKKVISRIARLMFLIFLLHEHWTNPWLFRLYCGDEILPNYMGILISQYKIYKDPYKPTSIMESRRVFFVAHMVPGGWTLWTAC